MGERPMPGNAPSTNGADYRDGIASSAPGAPENAAAFRASEVDVFWASFEQAPVGIAHVALDGRFLRTNPRLCAILGYTADEMQALRVHDVTHPDDLDHSLALMSDVVTGKRASYTLDKRYLKKNGEPVWVNLTVALARDANGAPQYCIGVLKEVSDRKQAEFELRDSKTSLELAITATGLGLFDYYPQTGIAHWSAEAKRHFGLAPDAQVDYGIFLDGIHPDDRERVDAELKQALRDPDHGRFLIEYRVTGTTDGKPRWLAAHGQVHFDSSGKAERCIGTVLDITQKKSADERIRHTALHDPLTGLPNRGLLPDHARHMFGRARRSRRHSAVLFIDLDRFKPINDNHGHEVGDAVLKEVARRLQACIRVEDVVFRLGGDEFLVMLQEIEDDASAREVARHMAQHINQPYHVNGLVLSLSLSVGISIFPRDGEDLDTLMSKADAAMYHAKQAGRNNVQFYCEELAARARAQSRIEEQVRTALAGDEFRLHYQPVIDMQTGRLAGVEALLRWPHDDIGPEQFVRVAEATGQIDPLCDWVIGEACRQHNKWRALGLPDIPIAINLSTVHLRQKDFVRHFLQLLAGFSVSASAFQIEVTEAGVMENAERANGALEYLQSLGIRITLDDFGTGYSSLRHLSGLPIDRIKVDRSFVRSVEHDAASRAIAEAVITLGRTLDLEVVAEGIESEAALHYLRDNGCHHAQGFHLCRPVPAAAFESWFDAHRASLLH